MKRLVLTALLRDILTSPNPHIQPYETIVIRERLVTMPQCQWLYAIYYIAYLHEIALFCFAYDDSYRIRVILNCLW